MVRIVIMLVLLFPELSELSAQTPQAIHTSLAIDIGGIKQWISIEATDSRHPVLLFLHGGPGNSVMSYADKFTHKLKEHFIVVQWDQRESGKTATLNASGKQLTVALMEADAVEMIKYLCARFSTDRIFLMGHSWGGFLGFMVARHNPELLRAYVAVCPMVNQLESETISLDWMMKKAKVDKNEKALHDLIAVKLPFQGGDQLYYHRAWLARMMGNTPPSRERVESWALTWLPLYNEAVAVNLFNTAPEIRCPVFFLIGDRDLQTNWEITRDYYETLKAPVKRIYILEGAGHSLNFREPEWFQDTVLKEILPTVPD